MSADFKNRLKAFEWVKDQGVKISRTKFYDAAGVVYPVKPDGSVPFAGVKQFAENLGASFDGEVPEEARREQALKNRKLEKQIERLDFDMDKERGKYLPRAEFDREMAARAILLDQGLRQLFKNHSLEMIHLVQGSPELSKDLQEFLNGKLDALMNRFASLEVFQVMVRAVEDDAA